MRLALTASFGFWLALFAGLVVAASQPQRAKADTGLWDLGDAKKGDYERYMLQADQSALASALPETHLDRDRRYRLAENAILAYELAIEADPSQAEPHYRAFTTIRRHYLDGDLNLRSKLRQAIGHLRAFVKKAPDDPRLLAIYNELSVNLTKLYGLEFSKSDLEEAIVHYDNELGLLHHAGPYEAGHIATLMSNQAEVQMMLGRLDKAIAGYEASIEFSDDPLSGYGLAVALDRDGQRTRARSVAKLYAEGDGGNRLINDNTFFVPHGEVYYYLAMRFEGLGEYRNAVAAYREYLRLLPRSKWAAAASRNLAELLLKAGKEPSAGSRQSKRTKRR